MIPVINFGQIITIPDPNFKQALLDENVDINADGEIDLSEAILIEELDVRNKNISTLEGIVAFDNLKLLRAGHNNITEIDELPANIDYLELENNGLENIDLSQVTALEWFLAPDNMFTELDLSNNPNVYLVFICNNPELEYLNIKTGNAFLNIACEPDLLCIKDCPKLSTICCNIQDVPCIDPEFLCYDPDQVIDVTPFCDTGAANSQIVISSFFDREQNNCDSESMPLQYMRYQITNGLSSVTYFQSSPDELNITLSQGNYTIRPLLNIGDCIVVEPEFQEVNITGDSMLIETSFCVIPIKEFTDLEVTLIPVDEARVSQESSYLIEVRNTGTLVTSGTLYFHFQELTSAFVSSVPMYDARNTNQLAWIIDSIAPFESKRFLLNLAHNGPQDTLPLNVDSILYFNSIISSEEDGYSNNDTSVITQTVVNSFDPNDKACLEGNTIYPNRIGNYLTYRIRFENIGTGNAINVTIVDSLDQSTFDITDIYLLESSHETNMSLDEHVLTFDFPNINLPFEDDFNDGYVIFRIKVNEDLQIGDQINNKAAIYFDTNFPIITNLTQTIIIDNEVYDYDYDGFGFDDCDNLNAEIFPSQLETPYNGIDDDCNLQTPDDDLDQDGFLFEDDCDDHDININPDAEEIPNNGIDEDCDGMDLTTNIYEASGSGVRVFPNPVEGFIHVQVIGYSNFTILLLDAKGNQVLSGTNKTLLDVSSFIDGIYFLKFEDQDSGRHIVEKILINN